MTHAHEPAQAVSGPHFSDSEWTAFQADDRGSAAVIIGLMTGIFSIGVCIYSIVALTVSATPMP